MSCLPSPPSRLPTRFTVLTENVKVQLSRVATSVWCRGTPGNRYGSRSGRYASYGPYDAFQQIIFLKSLTFKIPAVIWLCRVVKRVGVDGNLKSQWGGVHSQGYCDCIEYAKCDTFLYFVCKCNANINTDNITILSQWIRSVWCRRMSRVLKIRDASPDCARDFSISGRGTSDAKLTRWCRHGLTERLVVSV